MGAVVNPIVLYLACALAALGIAAAMPRKGKSLAAIGITLAGIAGGMVLVSLGIRALQAGELPNYNFYIFGAIALISAIRMITHPRPVYSALYFILTIVASCGLYLLLSAEFMAFALIIIYAGAILITYLFVIMLATQAPSVDDPQAEAEYDTTAREPGLAAGLGFLLLAALSTMMFAGVGNLPPISEQDAAVRMAQVDSRIAMLTRKVERELREENLISADERVHRVPAEDLKLRFDGMAANMNPTAGIIVVEGQGEAPEGAVLAPDVEVAGGYARVIGPDEYPKSLRELTNVEAVGFNLLADHPGSIEIAGVILLMAMLGATVLARRRVELGEEAERERAGRHLSGGETA